ncbi:hypothetical protein LTR56_006976 [Elasticomyces elasticus]|nr:hypothetical protein LTR56_006976 [Elasticomyces elasticus]KAK3664155.1 hypothetical protein LTR22_005120 [Elasticomyces elasticus]KAK4927724.1 hypothetical protein LTR49_005594 [Elasticomyces elasticus]KAK5767095.1 hypothetical protein LTS12_002861 [Elasticomyces elasticus]
MPRERVRLRLAVPPERRVPARDTPMRLLDTQPDVRKTAPSSLLALPPELREMIWDFVLGDTLMQIPSRKPGAYHMLNETRFRVPGIGIGKSRNILRAISLIEYPSVIQLPAMADTTPSRLLALPAELREMIWDYTLTDTIAQIPLQEDCAYAFGERQVRLRGRKDRVFCSDKDRLQAIKEQGHPAILRISKQIRHEALPRYYIFTVFQFDDDDTLLEWLSARPARVRKSITSVEFMLKDLRLGPAAALWVAQRTDSVCATLQVMLTVEGVALREGVLKARVHEVFEDDASSARRRELSDECSG